MPDLYLFVVGVLVTIVTIAAVTLVGRQDVDDLAVTEEDLDERLERNG